MGLTNTVFPSSTSNGVLASEPRTFGAAVNFRF